MIVIFGLVGVALLMVVGFIVIYKQLQQFTEQLTIPAAPVVNEMEVLIKTIRAAVIEQILGEDYPEVFDAIGAQRKILADHNRSAIMILLNEESFKHLLNGVFPESNDEYIESVAKGLIDIGMPVGFLGNLPIYVSTYLSEAPVFVVGDYKWEYRR